MGSEAQAPASSHTGITRYLASEVRAIAASRLPDDVVEVARQSVLDWLGNVISGGGEPLVSMLREEALAQGGNPLCSLVRHGDRTSPAFAALINGSAADALDFADGNNAMKGHTTPAVVAASLALAELKGASGAEFLQAVVAGVEMECRVGLAGNPYPAFHPTGTLAPFGAAAACSHLLGLSEEQWAHALGIAATQAAGLLASGGTMCKPMHSGTAAMNGLLAASLARRGFLARPDAIEAPEGFFATHAHERHDDDLYASSARFFILDTRFKVHAACGLTHCTIDNMLALRNEHGVAPQDVRRIEVQVSPGHLGVCNIAEPATGLEAKFSLRATAAMALLGEDMSSLATFNDECVTRAEVRELGKRISVTSRDDLTISNAVAIVELNDDRRLTLRSESRPLRDLALKRRIVSKKFLALVGPILGESAAEELQQCIGELDRAESVQRMLALSVPRRNPA